MQQATLLFYVYTSLQPYLCCLSLYQQCRRFASKWMSTNIAIFEIHPSLHTHTRRINSLPKLKHPMHNANIKRTYSLNFRCPTRTAGCRRRIIRLVVIVGSRIRCHDIMKVGEWLTKELIEISCQELSNTRRSKGRVYNLLSIGCG
jgi:hypothetical protein